ncbi:sensor histidine kinase [Dactylosporangium vinaceum]|uniref:Sensor histidine kinase n=1 Tax=Dactylosporangium vinaceum TaxID=53362 RepID=A0ABV5MH00_9ACTN|nr:sensor histidine kinase [Dactylosporangium vinaceum]UAB94931.1 sensor histidine kinase [Dactylosporangium vinaceum]
MPDRPGPEPGDVPLDGSPLSRRLWDVFYVLAVAAVVAFLLLDHGPGGWHPWVSAVLLVLCLGWGLSRSGPSWLFVLVVGGLQLAAVWIDHTAAFALFAWGPMIFQALPLRPALAVVAALDLLPVPMALIRDGTTQKVHGLLPLTVLGLAFAALIGTYVSRLHNSRLEIARLSREAGVATERARLAAEIHDTLAQGFTSIITLAQADSLPAGHRLDLVARTARDNLAEARALVAALAPADLHDAGLGPALRRQMDRFAADTGVRTALHLSDGTERVPTALQVVLLRAAQEALANARRHAAAASVELRLRTTGTEVVLTVTDDGTGIGPAPFGFGLAGMRSRAEQVGGSCTVTGSPGRGTTVTVTLPLPGGVS